MSAASLTPPVPSSYAAALASIAAARPDLSAAFDGLGAGARLSDLAADGAVLDRWLAAETALTPGLDGKAAAAFLTGRIAHAVCGVLVSLRFAAGAVPDLHPVDVALVREPHRWTVGALSGVTDRYALRFAADRAETTPAADDPGAALRLTLDRLHRPLVDALAARRLLGRAALWRIVSDAVASAYLDAGRRAGREDAARTEALAILRCAGCPLANRQTSFVRVESGCACAAEWFVSRGGCCRWYTVPGQEPCATCVLREPEDVEARLRALLDARAASATA
ncbi:ferric iron reductase [Chthonobacter rhizosphaerae]|uniref:ferric iron reductase n=1 Tax=Chthonobacter rhizosphaerae TaxID=2735553 RepID=UPI0015EEA69C|nr:ferric iron reductase [Chthonobacter rhizosphaerae]